VLDQAVRDSLGAWYAEAIRDSQIVPVGDPQLDLSDLPSEGERLEFSIEIGVLPKAQLGDYDGLEVPRRETAVEEQQIDQEIEGVRERPGKAGDRRARGRRGRLRGDRLRRLAAGATD